MRRLRNLFRRHRGETMDYLACIQVLDMVGTTRIDSLNSQFLRHSERAMRSREYPMLVQIPERLFTIQEPGPLTTVYGQPDLSL